MERPESPTLAIANVDAASVVEPMNLQTDHVVNTLLTLGTTYGLRVVGAIAVLIAVSRMLTTWSSGCAERSAIWTTPWFCFSPMRRAMPC